MSAVSMLFQVEDVAITKNSQPVRHVRETSGKKLSESLISYTALHWSSALFSETGIQRPGKVVGFGKETVGDPASHRNADIILPFSISQTSTRSAPSWSKTLRNCHVFYVS